MAGNNSRGILLLRCGELLYREGVALVRQGFVAGQAFGLVDTLLILFGSGENRVMPVFIAKKFGDVIPSRVPWPCSASVDLECKSHRRP